MKNGEYDLMVAPDDYPGKRYRGRYCYVHHYASWKKHGRLPNEGEEIDHINQNKRDNRPENLRILPGKTHRQRHSTVAWVRVTCPTCGEGFEVQPREYRDRINRGQTLHCSRSCSVKDQRSKGLLQRKTWRVAKKDARNVGSNTTS